MASPHRRPTARLVLRRGGGMGAQIRAPEWAYTGGNLKVDPPLDGRPAASAERRRRLGGPGSEPQSGRTRGETLKWTPPLTADRPSVLRGGGGLGPWIRAPEWAYTGGNLKVDPPPLTAERPVLRGGGRLGPWIRAPEWVYTGETLKWSPLP